MFTSLGKRSNLKAQQAMMSDFAMEGGSRGNILRERECLFQMLSKME
jgi:hypothetical protein